MERLGPTDLSIGTLFPDKSLAVPTVTDNLFTQDMISDNKIGVFYQPVGAGPLGEITFGGVDTSKTTGAVLNLYVPF